MILQMIAGAVAAAFVFLKVFWRRILRALHIVKATPTTEAAAVDTPPVTAEHQVQDR
jgi:hypothetical protein